MKKNKSSSGKATTDGADEGSKVSRESGLGPLPLSNEYDDDTSDEEVRSHSLSDYMFICLCVNL